MRYFLDSLVSPAYWKYVLFSRAGLQSILSVFGGVYLVVEVLDFFKVYTRDQYGSYAFIFFLILAAGVSIGIRRPIKSTSIGLPHRDFCIEIRIGDLFDAVGAIMVSTNTRFESDVAGGKISPRSLQGQFTAKYFTGNQSALIDQIDSGLRKLGGAPPYPMGTTIPITTHGKTFYLTAMANLNAEGNAATTVGDVQAALRGLWEHVRTSGELQELALPLIGTGRGRLQTPRNTMVRLIAESFVDASREGKLTDRLVIVIHPDDAKRFQVNLYELKDHLSRTLVS